MKYFLWLGGVLVTLVAFVYLMAFTAFGNGLVKPMIEKKIQAETKLESRLHTFSLSMSDFEILLELNKNNTVLMKGNYSLFARAFDIAYRVDFKELQTLQPLTKTQLQSSFATDGTVVGDMAFMEVDGKSDVAKSETTYHVELSELEATSIIAKVQNADLQSLLYLSGQKEYASARVNLDVNFKNITPHELDGNILLTTKDATLNSKVMKKDFNITIPATAFSMNLEAVLAGESADFTYMLNSNLAKISSSGRVTPEPLMLDVKYGVDIKELALLKPMTNIDLRGPLRLSGSAKGDKKSLVVQGSSDVASSESTFSAILKEFEPRSARVDIKNMQLQKVLYMLKQPHYSDGLLWLSADIKDARADSLSGELKTSIKNGLLNSKFLTKEYAFKSPMPTTSYTLQMQTHIEKNLAKTEANLLSNLLNIDVKEAKLQLDDASLESDYLARVHDLDKLYFLTQKNIKGPLIVNGELVKAKDLDVSAYSNIAGGKLVAKLHNDDLNVNINSMQTVEILDILSYKKIFKATIDGVFKYNLALKRGDFQGELTDGKFTQNEVLDLAKQYANADLYKETFVGDVDAKIAAEHIVASLDLKSNNSFLTTKDTKLNSKTQQIDSKIDISANKNPFSVRLTGDANRPKVTIDANELIKKEVNKFLKGLF